MARARNIKPSFFGNEYLAELPAVTRLLFIGLWTLADRMGRLEDRPMRIKGQLFPYENIDVDACLDMLASSEGDFIVRYVADGKRYIQVTNFNKHQSPHINEAASTIPAPDMQASAPEKHGTSTVQEQEKHDSDHAESLNLNPDSLNPESVIPPTPRKRGERNECAELFDVFWAHYPRKTAKQNALKAWQKLRPGKETAQTIIAAVRDQAKSPQWTRDDGQYIPHAATWLNGRRWEDEVQKQAPVPAAPRQRSVPAQQYTQREYTSEQLRGLIEVI